MAERPYSSVLVDAREPEWVTARTFGGAAVTVDYLPAGDLWAMTGDGALVAVERKTPTDLLGSLRDGRLFRQLADLRERTPSAYLVITGRLEAHGDGTVVCWEGPTAAQPRGASWRFDAVQGALLTAQELGVHVLTCLGDDAYEDAVLRLGKRERGAVRLPPLRPAAALDDREAFLCALPGIGPEKARALLDFCGSPAYALSCLTDTGALPPGFGTVIRERVRQLLDVPEGCFLAVNVNDAAPEALGVAPLVAGEAIP